VAGAVSAPGKMSPYRPWDAAAGTVASPAQAGRVPRRRSWQVNHTRPVCITGRVGQRYLGHAPGPGLMHPAHWARAFLCLDRSSGLSLGCGWRTSRGPARARLAFQPLQRELSGRLAPAPAGCLPGGPAQRTVTIRQADAARAAITTGSPARAGQPSTLPLCRLPDQPVARVKAAVALAVTAPGQLLVHRAVPYRPAARPGRPRWRAHAGGSGHRGDAAPPPTQGQGTAAAACARARPAPRAPVRLGRAFRCSATA